MQKVIRAVLFFIVLMLLVVAFIPPSFVSKGIIRNIRSQSKDLEIPVHEEDFSMRKKLAQLNIDCKARDSEAMNNTSNIKLLNKRLSENGRSISGKLIECELAYENMLAGNLDMSNIYVDKVNGKGYGLPRFLVRRFNYYLSSDFRDSYFKKNIGNENRLKGLLSLRLAEYQNCQVIDEMRTGGFCLLPADSSTFHTNTFGAERSIHYFQKDLDRNANKDPVTMWLYNMAHAVLGRYPELASKEYLIEFDKYQSSDTFVRFEEQTNKYGLGTVTYYGGSCVEDLDSDGKLDVFVTSGDLETGMLLFDGSDSGFVETTTNAGLEGLTGGVNIVQGDYDNDGWIDLFITRGGWLVNDAKYYPNSLLHNNGDGSFSDHTESSGLLNYTASHSAAWADFNNDGWLDLFVCNEHTRSQLFYNDGKGGFYDGTSVSGIDVIDYAKGVVAGDINNDGWEDLYISCYNSNNRLYLNKGERSDANEVQFTDITESSGTSLPKKSFSIAMFDFNNDGFEDIFCPNYILNMDQYVRQYMDLKNNVEPSMMYINNGDGTFSSLKDENLLRSTMSMGLNFADLDGDGWEDVYMNTGYPEYEALVPNLLFRNRNGEGFDDITFTSKTGHLQKGHGVSIADIDEDGDQDIYLSVGGFYESDQFANVLFLNTSEVKGWIELNLLNDVSKGTLIGTRVKIVKDDTKQVLYRTLRTGGSYGASPLRIHAGLGDYTGTVSVFVEWPGNRNSQELKKLTINTSYDIHEEEPVN